MSQDALTAELAEAIEEVQHYLCDEMAPMMASDSVRFLMDHPPSLLVPHIHSWVGSQCSRGDARYTAADYIYHALKKLHLIGEFHLVDAKELKSYLDRTAQLLLPSCAEEDRERLRQQLAHLGESAATLTSAPVERIYSAGGGKPAGAGPPGAPAAGGAQPGPAAGEAMNAGLRRFSLLLERLGRSGTVGVKNQVNPEIEQVREQALVTAAVQAGNDAELQALLRRLGSAGIDSRSEMLFKMLGRSLPAWNLPMAPGTEGEGYTNRPMEAMRKMVALAETPQEWARRFNDLVQAAIEQFNEGSLARAAAMLDLAERMLVGKDKHLDVVTAIRRRAHEAINEEQLRKLAELPDEKQGLLRFMNFFPAMTVAGLLKQLNGESKRERRWLLLLLLEAYGEKAREGALNELEEFMRGDKKEQHGYHQRNLVYLLRRIPAGDAGPSPREVEAVVRLTKPDQPPILVREALRTLGQMQGPTAEKTLLGRLKEFEAAALRAAPSTGEEPNPILGHLDGVCSALAAQRSGGCWVALAQHAMREEAALGDAAARIDVLGMQDLSALPDFMNWLLQTLRDRLPKKILGLVLQKRERIHHLIRALAGTPAPPVQALLEEIASKYPSQEFGSEAAKALDSLKAAVRRADQSQPGLSGDIGLFSLPTLFQSLADSKVTGVLTLRKERGVPCGAVHFREGSIEASEYTHLKGEDALYQLFEKPEACSFEFRSGAPAAEENADAKEPLHVMPLLLEAMRRHDELQQARALVPDGAVLKTTGTKPKKHEEEADIPFTQAVWSKAATGSTPEQCEASVQGDAYRVRKLLAYWVEGGALEIGAAAPEARQTAKA